MEEVVLLPSINNKRTEVYFVPLEIFLEKISETVMVTEQFVRYMIPFATVSYFGRQGDDVLELFGLTRWQNDRCREVWVNLPAGYETKLAAA